jgi:hypothetical protein
LASVVAVRAANPATTFFPIDDGDPNTSEYGYAGSSGINAVSFICSSLVTISNKQIFAYYGRHQTNSTYVFNNTIWIARRTVGTNIWEVFRTAYTANNVTDGHDVVSFGIDGDGILHMSWGMHGDAFHYSHSLTNVVGSEPIVMGPDSTMTGNENTATYPQFMSLPDGDLLYIYRKGSSGAGDTFVSRYSHLNKAWTPVHTNGSIAAPFIKGTGWPLDYNAYGQMPCLDSTGKLSLIWTWRYTPAFESNHDFDFAASPDQGLTWQRSDGSTYTLPIDESTSASASCNFRQISRSSTRRACVSTAAASRSSPRGGRRVRRPIFSANTWSCFRTRTAYGRRARFRIAATIPPTPCLPTVSCAISAGRLW